MLTTIHVDKEEIYTPKTKDQYIHLSVIIGDGQSGGFFVMLEKKPIPNNGDIVFGKAANVLNKRGFVIVTVVDELDETNMTSVTLTLTEGNKKTVFGPYSQESNKNLDTVTYHIKILFQA